MSKQKIMYIIAIVLLAGGSFNSVSAESLVDTSVNEVEGVIRNDTLTTDTASTQQNTEKDEEKISQAFGTSGALSSTIDALVSGTIGSGVAPESENFCSALDSALMKQSDISRASLAWNPASYEKNINLKYQGADGSQASLHESTQNAFKSVSPVLKSLAPKSSTAIDSVMISRYQAIVRSALVEMNMILKAKEVDSDRAEGVAKLLVGSIGCVEAYTSADESNSAQFSSVKTTLGEVVAGWEANKNLFGVASAEAVKEPFYLKITSKDSIGEDENVPAVSDEVKTKDDLASYLKNVAEKNTSIKDFVVDDGSVTIRYATKAKLFGFIPVWLTPKTTVNTLGEVSVSYPWYSGLTSKKAKISVDTVKEELIELGLVSEVVPETPSLEMSMQYRARLSEALGEVIESGLDVKKEEVEKTNESMDTTEESVETENSTETIEVAPQA